MLTVGASLAAKASTQRYLHPMRLPQLTDRRVLQRAIYSSVQHER
jgi:hypothetical protein